MKIKCNKCGKVFEQEPDDVILLTCEECRDQITKPQHRVLGG